MKLPLNRLVSKLVINASSAGKNEISKCSQCFTFESRLLALLAAPSDDVIVDVTGNAVRKVTRKGKHDGYIRGFLFLPLYENLVYTKLINLFLKVHVRHLLSVVFGAGNSNFEAFEIDVMYHYFNKTAEIKAGQFVKKKR